MGRPKVKQKNLQPKSEENNAISSETQKSKGRYRNKFKSFLGNASTGRGNVGSRLVRRFKKRLEKKKTSKTTSYNEPRPLADDLQLRGDKSLNHDDNENTFTSTATDPSLISSVSSNDSTLNLSRKSTKRQSKHIPLVHVDYKTIQEERKKQFEEIQANRTLHEETISKNLQKRQKIAKKLAKRTKRGQPVMRNQMEHILNKLKNS